LAGGRKVARQKKQEIHYALDHREDAVFLVRRALDARLMAGMWELPELLEFAIGAREQQVPPARFANRRNDKTRGNDREKTMHPEPYFTVRHSITVTDYTVRVWRRSAPKDITGKWIAVERLGRVALTGLARKILRKADIIIPSETRMTSSKYEAVARGFMHGLRNLLKRQTGGTMAALATGTKAPEFELKGLDGKRFSLNEELGHGPVVLVFFKVSCPTCQYALPFFERLHKAYGGKAVRVVGISQNESKDTTAFIKEFGITFPVLLDDTRSYPASNAYGLTNVPSIFWVAEDREIEVSSVGWFREDFEQVNSRMAEAGKTAPAAVFSAGESVRDFQAG
jgi:peroxiredoxin